MFKNHTLSNLYHLLKGTDLFYKSVAYPLPADEIRIFMPDFTSKHSYFLLALDQIIFSNICFKYLFFLPRYHHWDSCLIIGHGFNEATYTKLIPWAYTLCKELCLPTIVFPLSFHMNRRGNLWQRNVISSYCLRKGIPGNQDFSPFNAVVSRMIAENPERFFRGYCQSYYDLLSLIQKITRGDLKICYPGRTIRPFTPNTQVHFLGYSISGYLHLAMLLIHGKDILKNSRCILFLSGASGYDMHPVSPFVIDRDAFLKTGAFYLEKYRSDGSKEFLQWFLETEVGFWFRQMFLQQGGSSYLKKAIKNLGRRLFLLADPEDTIFPFEGIKNNIGSVPYHLFKLGIHEFPFNICSIDGKSYKELHTQIKESYHPSPHFKKRFREFVQYISFFLQPSERS